MTIYEAARMASRRNGTLYTGGFTRRYGCKLLVWYEMHETMESAIAREKQIKAGSRGKKIALIEGMAGRIFSRN